MIHLDQHYWKAGWVETPSEEWVKTVTQLTARDHWIIDGNYGGTVDIRLERADTVVLVTSSTATCMYRVLKRIFKNHGKVRPDMPSGCPERLDATFLDYVFHFNKKRLPPLLEKLEQIKHKKKVFHLDSNQKVATFLANL